METYKNMNEWKRYTSVQCLINSKQTGPHFDLKTFVISNNISTDRLYYYSSFVRQDQSIIREWIDSLMESSLDVQRWLKKKFRICINWAGYFKEKKEVEFLVPRDVAKFSSRGNTKNEGCTCDGFEALLMTDLDLNLWSASVISNASKKDKTEGFLSILNHFGPLLSFVKWFLAQIRKISVSLRQRRISFLIHYPIFIHHESFIVSKDSSANGGIHASSSFLCW